VKKINRRDAILAAGTLPILLSANNVKAQVWEGFDDLYIKPPWLSDGKRTMESPPGKLVEEGRIRLGVFNEPCRSLNLLESKVLGGTDKRWWGGPKLQEWMGYGLIHDDWYFGMIIMDLKLVSFATVYAHNRKTGQSFSHDGIDFGKKSGVAESNWNGKTYLTKDNFKMEFVHDLNDSKHQIIVDVPEKDGKPSVKMDLILCQNMKKFQPLVISMPIEPEHYMYTHKAVMEVSGHADIGGEKIKYNPEKDLIVSDEFKSYWPVPKRWTWGTAVGKSQSGKPVAINMVDYYTENQDIWNENCVWVDGKMSLVGSVEWKIDLKNPMKPWRLREENGLIDLSFFPEAGKTMDLMPVPFKYYQKCGRYEGYFIDGKGEKYLFDDLYGPAENGRIG
jgi:uncharacterized protein DUF2804